MKIPFFTLVTILFTFPQITYSQSIVPNQDGTKTIINQQQNQINITGGQLSNDRQNLFHSFSKFNLNNNETANFITNPTIQNILGKINGGDPSIINGQIQVSGGNSNLVLMNPFGWVFGQNASLNLPASFTLTTSNGIKFNQGEFTTIGTNNYHQLNGSPTGFIFTNTNPEKIINQGNLVLNNGQNLTLVGGDINNHGQLTSKDGKITISSVPGTSLVRINQLGNLLSLEIPQSTIANLTPQSLPKLLTGNINAKTINIQGTGNIYVNSSKIQTQEDLTITTPQTIIIRDSVQTPVIINSGNRLTLQGTQGIDIFALNNSQSGLFSGYDLTLKSNQTIVGDAHYYIGKNFRIEQLDGSLGSLSSPNDPVIRSSGDVSFLNYTGASLHIIAGGSVTIPGTIIINGVDTVHGLVESVTLSPDLTVNINGQNTPTLDIRAGTNNIGLVGISGSGTFTPSPPTTGGSPTSSNITLGNITINNPSLSRSIVFITNQYFPNNSLGGGNIQIDGIINTRANFLTAGIAGNGGDVYIIGKNNVTVNQIITGTTDNQSSGSIYLKGVGNVNTTGILSTESPNQGNSGNITIVSETGNIDTSNGGLITRLGGTNISGTTAGKISLTAQSDIKTQELNSSVNSTSAVGNSGDITLKSSTQTVTTQNIIASNAGSGNSGNISIDAAQDITSGNITTNSGDGNAGNVFVKTQQQSKDITVGYINTSTNDGNGGQVDINATRFFRAINSFANSNGINASIDSSGVTVGGKITVRHGGNGLTPFIVGNSEVNGTNGAIVSNTNLTPNRILTNQSFPESYTQGNIQIITGKVPPCNEVGICNPPTTKGETPNPTQPENTPEKIDDRFTEEFGGTINNSKASLAKEILQNIEENTGVKPALIYASFLPEFIPLSGEQVIKNNSPLRENYQLELVMVTGKNPPIRRTVNVKRRDFIKVANKFRKDVTNPRNDDFMVSSQQLYQWLITPIEGDLKNYGVNNLVFIMEAGMRSLPVAAFHDGKQFLVEKYSVGLMPSLSLTDTRYVDIKKTEVLAMGAETFKELKALPAVPLELDTIAGKLWKGKSFINEQFTAENIINQRRNVPYGILHLATHGEFKSGKLSNSYIQLWDRQLRLDQIRELSLNNPPVELMILSACRTALGDEEAELGFAGLANQAGVKSAMGSLWSVSDEGTLGLMTSFYGELKTAPIKAEALRQAQLDLLTEKVKIVNGKLRTKTSDLILPEKLQNLGNINFNHPYYWAGFTIVGNPW